MSKLTVTGIDTQLNSGKFHLILGQFNTTLTLYKSHSLLDLPRRDISYNKENMLLYITEKPGLHTNVITTARKQMWLQKQETES